MPRYINGSYGVLPSSTAVETVAEHQRAMFSRTHQPQLNFTNDRVTADDRLRAKSSNFAAVFGENAPYRLMRAPMAHSDQATSRVYHCENMVSDGATNSILAEGFRGPRTTVMDEVPFTMYGDGSLYAQDYYKFSKRKRRSARAQPVPPDPPRKPTSIGDFSGTPLSKSREDSQRVWQRPELTVPQPAVPGPPNNLELLGAHTDHLLRSQSQVVFGAPASSQDAAASAGRRARSAVPGGLGGGRELRPPRPPTTVHLGLLGVGALGLGRHVGLPEPPRP